MKRQRMRDQNSSLFISLQKCVNFNNTFSLLLYFFLCQDTSGKMFLSIRQNKFLPKFNFFVIRQIKFRQIMSLLRSAKFLPAKISSLKRQFEFNYTRSKLNPNRVNRRKGYYIFYKTFFTSFSLCVSLKFVKSLSSQGNPFDNLFVNSCFFSSKVS